MRALSGGYHGRIEGVLAGLGVKNIFDRGACTSGLLGGMRRGVLR